jgi:ABC-type transport system involved in cytochrome bd biosynthesis fused ATPase/permease subunit
VLIDEIENAGIDRKRALNLLVNEEKIVLMATHDPSLALMADKRIVIKNGGIYKVIETGSKEKEVLKELEKMDKIINTLRFKLRSGDTIDTDFGEEMIS